MQSLQLRSRLESAPRAAVSALGLSLCFAASACSEDDGATGSETGQGSAAACALADRAVVSALIDAAELTALAPTPADDFASGFTVLEGPTWRDGALYLSQINANVASPPPARLLRHDVGATAFVVVDADSGSNGLQPDPSGRLAAARHSDGTVSYIDVQNPGAAAVPLATSFDGQRFNSPNDLVFHPNGTLYFSDPDWQAPTPRPQTLERAYRVAPGGTPEPIMAALTEPTVVQKPNGIVVSADERSLFLGGTNGLFRFNLDAQGAVTGTSGERIAVPNEGEGVDGMTLDCAGNLYVTTGNRVLVLDPSASLIGALAVPHNPTNVELGGPDGQTLYVTTLEGMVNGAVSKPALYSADWAPAR
jgi:gluconolactonase